MDISVPALQVIQDLIALQVTIQVIIYIVYVISFTRTKMGIVVGQYKEATHNNKRERERGEIKPSANARGARKGNKFVCEALPFS